MTYGTNPAGTNPAGTNPARWRLARATALPPVLAAPRFASRCLGLLALASCVFVASGLALAAPRAGATADPGADFLRQTGTQPGVKTLPDGLEYKILQSGDPHGTPPAEGDELVLNYDGQLPDGATFDSTEQQGGMAHLPFQGLIPGWMEGLKLMRPGDVWMLYIPAKLGYGEKGAGPVPPNSPLVFKVELVAVHHAG